MRPMFYEVYAVVEGVPIRAIGWNYFDEPTILFIKPPYVYYYHYRRNVLERCINYWYIYREKRIGRCEEVEEFLIHIVPHGEAGRVERG